jgi:hypothetical protein
MNEKRYDLSFTTGALLRAESVKMATLYLDLNDWDSVRDAALSTNLVQARTVATSKRVCREICSRLKALNERELQLLVNGTAQEQAYLLWLAICRRYEFLADLATEVIHERYISLNYSLSYEDFDSFFNAKSEWHPEMDAVTSTTRSKLRQVVFRMLREAGLLAKDNTMIAAMFSRQFLDAISPANRANVKFFPVLDAEVKRNIG